MNGGRPEVKTTIETQPTAVPPAAATIAGRVPARALAAARYLAAVAALGLAYYAAGRASLALQYTGPVAAIWLPAGVAAAALYFAGLRHWPAVVIADLALADAAQPIGTVLALTAGNVADVVVIAALLRILVGPRAALDRLEQVGWMLVAIATGAAITATGAVLSMRAGDVIPASDVTAFWRSWALADATGALVVIPLALAWMRPPSPAWRGRGLLEGALMLAAVAGLSTIALSRDLELTYMVFPALIWAVLRFGQQGATLAVAAAAALTVSITAHEDGAFVELPISDAVLNTQLYIAVAAITTLCLGAILAESRRHAVGLADSKRREGQVAVEERQRIARDLHDSVSQSLFSTALHLRTAERALEREGFDPDGTVGTELGHVKQLTGGALAEMRALVFELRPGALAEDGVVAAVARHAAAVGAREELAIAVDGPDERLPLAPAAEEQLYRLVQEALANVVKHAHAGSAAISITLVADAVEVRVRDDGRGFSLGTYTAGFGLRSMRARAADLGGRLEISSAPHRGTTVRARIPAAAKKAAR